MKIVIVGTAHPYRGGLAAFNERLAQQFTHEGHQVEIVTFTLQYPALLFPGKTQYSNEPAPEGLHIARQINAINPFNWIKVGNAIRKKNADLVIFAYWMSFMAPCMGTIARRIRRNKTTTCVALVHNMIPHEPNILDKFLPYYFTNAMDGFVALSQAVVHDIERFDKSHKPKASSPHPIYDHYGKVLDKETALRALALPNDCRYALFFGFIRPYKGLDLLLDAFADERLKQLNVKLIVAGEFYGDPKPYLDQIERLGIADRVVLRTDFIPDSEVNRYFCAADIVAQPYKTATQSGVTQIAYHFERPMLVTRVGGLPEIVPDGITGYVADPCATDIADKLATFFALDDTSIFAQNLRKEKKKYAWSNMTATLIKIQNDTKK